MTSSSKADPPHSAKLRSSLARRAGRTGLPLLLASFVSVASCASAPDPAPVPAPGERETLHLQVIHTNDFHGRLLPQVAGTDTVGGSALEAAHFDSLRVRFPEGPTILLSGGDVMQGTAVSNLSWGRAAIDVYNRKGYDAAALGNHEFDWGLDTLRARVDESDFAWLGANVVDARTGETPEWIRRWVVMERGGVRVGVVGVALEETPELVMAGRTEGIRFLPEAPAIDEAVREVRAEGVHFVVVTGHVGAVCEESGEAPEELSRGCSGRLVEITRALTEPVDLFVGGHTHLRNLTQEEGVPLAQVPAYSVGYSLTRLTRDPDGLVRTTHRSIRPPGTEGVDPDTTMARVVSGWVEEVGPLLEQPVATLAREISNAARRPVENPAGNLLADAFRWATQADAALVNNGSLRRTLPAGALTFGVLYEFQPFQNEVVTVQVTGERLRSILEFGLTEDGEPWTHISGLRARRVQGERRVEAVLRPDGRTVGPEEQITLATSEFLAAGGDGYRQLAELPARRSGWVDVDALAAYLETLPSPVVPPRTDRWTLALPP